MAGSGSGGSGGRRPPRRVTRALTTEGGQPPEQGRRTTPRDAVSPDRARPAARTPGRTKAGRPTPAEPARAPAGAAVPPVSGPVAPGGEGAALRPSPPPSGPGAPAAAETTTPSPETPAAAARTAPAPGGAGATARRAVVRFTAEPAYTLTGELVAGGQLVIEYDPARVQLITGTALVPEQMTAHVRFSPGGESEEQSALALVAAGGPSARLATSRPLVVDVPAGAREAEVWFALRADGREHWDSNYGRNFRFTVGG